MIIECKKKPKDYESVKGNETKIVIHVLNHNYYDHILWENERPRNKSRIYVTKFKGEGKGTLTLKMRDFFRLNDDGSISKFMGEVQSTEYVAVEFEPDRSWKVLNWIYNAPNISENFKRTVGDNPPHNRYLQLGSVYLEIDECILIFEKQTNRLIEILPGTSADMIDVLQENGYYITKKDPLWSVE